MTMRRCSLARWNAFERGTQDVKMCLEIFGSLEIALHRIETFRYEAENDNEDNI